MVNETIDMMGLCSVQLFISLGNVNLDIYIFYDKSFNVDVAAPGTSVLC